MTVVIRGAGVEGAAISAGLMAHAEGSGGSATGNQSHAEGSGTNATGNQSHAEGSSTGATNTAAHAEGNSTTASGTAAHAEGSGTTASGASAHAEGANTAASGTYAHAQGRFAAAGKYGQHAQSSVQPSALSSTVAQYSIYTTSGSLAATNGSTIELCFDNAGSATLTGAGTSVLVIPLKSLILVNYDIIARPNATASATADGASWSGSILLGRGNSTGTVAGLTQSTSTTAGAGNTNLPLTYGLTSNPGGLFLQCAIVSTDTTNNYVRFVMTNSTSGVAWSVFGVLRCVELVTSV